MTPDQEAKYTWFEANTNCIDVLFNGQVFCCVFATADDDLITDQDRQNAQTLVDALNAWTTVP